MVQKAREGCERFLAFTLLRKACFKTNKRKQNNRLSRLHMHRKLSWGMNARLHPRTSTNHRVIDTKKFATLRCVKGLGDISLKKIEDYNGLENSLGYGKPVARVI